MQSKNNPPEPILLKVEEPFKKDTPEGLLAHRLYMARCRIRLSQLELTEIANTLSRGVYLTQQRVSEIERGLTKPSFLEVCAIAKAMSCQLVEFDVL